MRVNLCLVLALQTFKLCVMEGHTANHCVVKPFACDSVPVLIIYQWQAAVVDGHTHIDQGWTQRAIRICQLPIM
jgi:hypothetical protein